jgi:hypothetical protein
MNQQLILYGLTFIMRFEISSSPDHPRSVIEECKKVRESPTVYLDAVRNAVPRTLGRSRIVYIGQTESSLAKRYGNRKEQRALELGQNRLFYEGVISKYGPVATYTCLDLPQGLSSTQIEQELLATYYLKHLELPPKNSQGPGSLEQALKRAQGKAHPLWPTYSQQEEFA